MSKKSRAKNPVTQAIQANILHMLNPPSEQDRAKAKVKAAQKLAEVEQLQQLSATMVLEAIQNSQFNILRQAEELGFTEQHPVYQRAVDAYAVGTESAAQNMKRKLT